MKIYLACPFSSPYFWVRWYRVWIATRCCAALMEQGHIVFSPLTHSWLTALFMPKQYMMDHKFWMKQDLFFLQFCEKLIILKTKDWWKSKGVLRERRRAVNKFMPVELKTPKEILNGKINQKRM